MSNIVIENNKVYLLKADFDGTLYSRCDSMGVAVSSEAEARKFVEESTLGYFRAYEEIEVFSTSEEASEITDL